jgi:hypothetical protein
MDIKPETTVPEFVRRAYNQSLKTINAHAEPYAFIERVNELFIATITVPALADKFVRVFAGMSHAAFLSAAQLGTSGQLPTLYMAARGCVETAITGFYLSQHPELRHVWLNRHGSEDAKKKARETFSPGKMKKELKQVNPAVGDQWESFYEASIDYGAHPNVLGFWASFDPTESGGEGAWLYLRSEGPFFSYALTNVAYAGLTALFTLEYPLRMELLTAGITHRLVDLQKEVAAKM